MGRAKYLSLINRNNDIDLVEILCTFYLEEYHSNYIVYSLNKNSLNNKNIIHVGKIIKVEDREYLFNIDSYDEWSKLKSIINKINKYGLEGGMYE